jgi:hypothetical protein
MPPKETMQNGVRVASMRLIGSQKPTETPTVYIRGHGAGQMHISGTSFSMSSWPSVATGIGPIDIGRMQLQQRSVMGFGNLPKQVTDDEAVCPPAFGQTNANATATTALTAP